MDPDDDQHFSSGALNAGRDTPWLKVHVLAEFVFCARAGIVEFEKNHDDEGAEEEEPRANVNYVPHHELDAIIRDIESTTRSLLRWLPVPVISLMGTLAAGWWFGWCPAVVGVFFTMGMTKPIFLSLERLRQLKIDYAATQTRKAAEPNPAILDDQNIDWWELYKAKFESFRPPRKLEDEDTRLVGRPWRIMRRGGVMIPVFKMRVDGLDEPPLHPKHYVRIAAYCHLLERGPGVQSPYGIVLFGYTFKGKALNASAARNTFRDELLAARRAVRESRQGDFPQAAPPNLCSGCRHGNPVVTRLLVSTRPTTVPGETTPIVTKVPEYHSDCGDRFAWTPPHEKALRKGLAQ